jgi:hypothetical protein
MVPYDRELGLEPVLTTLICVQSTPQIGMKAEQNRLRRTQSRFLRIFSVFFYDRVPDEEAYCR